MDKAQRTMLFNPYTGRPRDPRDIASDPAGVLMVDPDEPLFAAAPAAQPSAEWLAKAERLVDHYVDASIKCETFTAIRSARAALLAHLRTKT